MLIYIFRLIKVDVFCLNSWLNTSLFVDLNVSYKYDWREDKLVQSPNLKISFWTCISQNKFKEQLLLCFPSASMKAYGNVTLQVNDE